MRKRFHLGRVTPWWLLKKIDHLFIKLCWAELVMWKRGYEVKTFSRSECSSSNGCDYCGKPSTAAKQWPAINRERGRLIDKRIARTLTAAERTRLEELQAYADEYIQRVAPRSSKALDELEGRLGITPGGPRER